MKRAPQSRMYRLVTTTWQPTPASMAGVKSTTFGTFLRRQRVAKGFSRSLVAERSGVKEGTIEKIELNQASPSYQDIKALALLLGVPEQELMQVAGYVKRA